MAVRIRVFRILAAPKFGRGQKHKGRGWAEKRTIFTDQMHTGVEGTFVLASIFRHPKCVNASNAGWSEYSFAIFLYRTRFWIFPRTGSHLGPLQLAAHFCGFDSHKWRPKRDVMSNLNHMSFNFLSVPASFRDKANPNFTIKRMYDSAREEFEQLERLREVCCVPRWQ